MMKPEQVYTKSKSMARFFDTTGMSRGLFERAERSIPSGSTRAPFFASPYQLYLEKGKGCNVWDVDGNRYVDFVNNMGPLILGHRDPRVEKAVSSQVESLWCGGPTETEIDLAESILQAFPFCDRLLFTPSGTEADMKLIRAARVKTGKRKIATISGSYHGTSDSLSNDPGIPKVLKDLTLHFRFNDEESLTSTIRESQKDLAAVVLEGVLGGAGAVPPTRSFLRVAREETQRLGVPLIFDEVVTGFRLGRGGVSETFGIKPDGVALGKIIGGGFPVGAFLGTSELMQTFEYGKGKFPLTGDARIRHSGTFNAHPVAMAAGLATLDILDADVYSHIDHLGETIRKVLAKVCAEARVSHSVTGIGSMFRLHFSRVPVVDNESLAASNEQLGRLFDFLMLERGMRLAPFHGSFCSSPMGRKELDAFEDAATGAVQELKSVMKPAPTP